MIKISILGILLLTVTLYGLHVRKLFANSVVLHKITDSYSRDYFLGSPENPALTYVALGDSTAQGVGTQSIAGTYPHIVGQALADKGNYVRVINLGVTGAKSIELLEDQMPQLSALRPDVITVTIGGNDATRFVSFRKYKQNMKSVINQLNGYKSAKVLMATAPDMGLTPSIQPILSHIAGYKSRQQNKIFRELVSTEADNIMAIDLEKEARLDYKDNHNYYASDLFHPADAGYQIWAELIKKRL